MHTITKCPKCGEDFMYHESDHHLRRSIKTGTFQKWVEEEFPIQDEIWPSRRWSEDRTDYCDLEKVYIVICQNCHKAEIEKTDNFEWTDKKVILFTNWLLRIHKQPFRCVFENKTLLENFKQGDKSAVWRNINNIINNK